MEDEAAWLLERMRAGELTKERLELAARLGHEAANLAHLECGSEVTECGGELIEAAAEALSLRASVAFAADCTERACAAWTQKSSLAVLSGGVSACRAWLRDGRADVKLESLAARCKELAESEPGESRSSHRAYNAAQAALCLCRAVLHSATGWSSAAAQCSRYALGEEEEERQIRAVRDLLLDRADSQP